MIKNILMFFVFMVCLISCSTTGAVYKVDYDFSKIKNVYVEDCRGGVQEQAIKDAIIKQLMFKNYNVKATSDCADIIVSYSITQYQPGKKYLIRDNSNQNNSAINVNVYTNDTLEIGGSSVYDLGSAFGVKDSRIIASNATVGVSVTIKDVDTKDIIWTHSYTYEGMDLTTAINGVVKYILKNFPPEKNN